VSVESVPGLCAEPTALQWQDGPDLVSTFAEHDPHAGKLVGATDGARQAAADPDFAAIVAHGLLDVGVIQNQFD
jgi:hypothetical protein